MISTGGSLKKYNSFDYHMLLVGIIVPFLAFFISMNTVYAYFTATSVRHHSSSNTAIVKINIADSDNDVTNSNNVSVYNPESAEKTLLRNVLPGDTISVSGTIVNKSTAECYVILQFGINVTQSDNSVETVCNKIYTFAIDEEDSSAYVQKEIIGTTDNYNITAKTICADNENENNTEDERAFELSYTFYGCKPTEDYDGVIFDDSYKHATISYFVKVFAIQSANLASTSEQSAIVATNLLIEQTKEN